MGVLSTVSSRDAAIRAPREGFTAGRQNSHRFGAEPPSDSGVCNG